MISSLKLNNFRNYNEKNFSFGQKTIICGKNGIGKTNLLEAINLCSTTKSFRSNPDSSLVCWGSDYYRLESEINLSSEISTLEIIYQKTSPNSKKITKVNKNKVSLANFVGLLKVVIYSFESNEIILGSPGTRRKFLDMLLCQVDQTYTHNLIKFYRVLKNRNELLYKIRERLADPDELDFWDAELCNLSSEIYDKRSELVNFLNKNINDFYNQISNIDGVIKITLDSHSILDIDQLHRFREKEIKKAITLYGPHRDDVLFLINGDNVADHLSRGEIKSVLFALKKSEAEFVFDKCLELPLILIDDIFAELDASRREKLVNFIEKNQVIITSTEEDDLKKLFKKSDLVLLNG